MTTFLKRGTARALAWEHAGLAWLSESATVPVVPVLALDSAGLRLQRLRTVAPTPPAAEGLGRALAALHSSPVDGFGTPPRGWQGPGYLGPSTDLLDLPLPGPASWGPTYAAQVRAVSQVAHRRGHLPDDGARDLELLCRRLEEGSFDDETPPARVHGDLWSGNVLWTDDGAVVIDPAAHGGHPQLDLAVLALFGAPHLERTLAAYEEVAPLPAGWRERQALHQVLHLVLHVACFGSSWLGPTALAARRYL